MKRFQASRILPIALVVVIIVIAIAALVSLARLVFFSGSSSTQTPAVVDVSREALLSSGASHRVSMTVRGPIVADESFHSIAIVVSPSFRELKTYRGYLDTIVDKVVLANNTAAYEEFVHALDKANLSKGTELTGDKNDVRGVCATGQVFEFRIIDGDSTVKHLWTSTCSGSRGSLNANANQLSSLFRAQIPNANALTRKVGL